MSEYILPTGTNCVRPRNILLPTSCMNVKHEENLKRKFWVLIKLLLEFKFIISSQNEV